MSELLNVQHLLEEARRAADAGDLAEASARLQDAARIQEAELGPIHPELANTLNNLGVVAENRGQIGEAEGYYRRAVAITSAALSPDDPMVASSRKNLEDFCRERGLPFDPPVTPPPIQRPEHTSHSVVHDQPAGQTKTPAPVPVVVRAEVDAKTSTPTSSTRPLDRSTEEDTGRLPSPAAATTTKRPLAIVATALIVVVAATLVVMRPWSRGDSPAPGRSPDGAAAQQAAAPAPSPTTPAPAPAASEKPQSPAVASRNDKASVAAANAPKSSSGGITLVTSQLCRTFSVSGHWRCDPAGQSVSPGAIVLYTRVKSPRNAIVIHRWYRGDTLRKSARLTILANPTDGYRTFSRQTVKSGENWRVEVTDTAGDVLYEQRLSVR